MDPELARFRAQRGLVSEEAGIPAPAPRKRERADPEGFALARRAREDLAERLVGRSEQRRPAAPAVAHTAVEGAG